MDSSTPLQLQSDCNIRTAREHHRALVDAFQTGDEIEIDAGRVERVDLTFIQLLASAMKTAKASQKRCRLVSVSEPLRGALARAGVRLSPSDDQIMWG